MPHSAAFDFSKSHSLFHQFSLLSTLLLHRRRDAYSANASRSAEVDRTLIWWNSELVSQNPRCKETRLHNPVGEFFAKQRAALDFSESRSLFHQFSLLSTLLLHRRRGAYSANASRSAEVDRTLIWGKSELVSQNSRCKSPHINPPERIFEIQRNT